MPKAKAPAKTSDTAKPRARRKARPRYEVAPEQVATPAAVWAYRDTEPEAVEVDVAVTRVERKDQPISVPDKGRSENPLGTLSMMAFGVVALGIGTFIHVALFTVKTLNSPVRMATGILGRLRRA